MAQKCAEAQHHCFELKADGILKAGDSVVVVQGKNNIVGSTNTMRIQYA